MQHALLILALLSNAHFASARSSQDDDSINDFERGIICRGIDAEYPNTLPADDNMDGWLNCREDATFMRIDDYNGVMIKISKRDSLSCSARIVSTRSKQPRAEVKCKKVSAR